MDKNMFSSIGEINETSSESNLRAAMVQSLLWQSRIAKKVRGILLNMYVGMRHGAHCPIAAYQPGILPLLPACHVEEVNLICVHAMYIRRWVP
jgi:hypothetical protein